MKTRKASRAFDAEIKRDCAWFRSNPAKTRLRRKVTGQELPRHLRRLGIVEVVIERAGPAKFVRTFFARDGWALASGIDELEDEAVPGAPGSSPKFGPRSGRVRVRRLAKGLRVRQLLRTCQ